MYTRTRDNNNVILPLKSLGSLSRLLIASTNIHFYLRKGASRFSHAFAFPYRVGIPYHVCGRTRSVQVDGNVFSLDSAVLIRFVCSPLVLTLSGAKLISVTSGAAMRILSRRARSVFIKEDPRILNYGNETRDVCALATAKRTAKEEENLMKMRRTLCNHLYNSGFLRFLFQAGICFTIYLEYFKQ